MSAIDPELDAALTQAMNLARRGERHAAEHLIRHIRQDFTVSSSVEIAVRVMLAEGVMHANDGEHNLARDRIWRALELSRRAEMPALLATAHAWMAFLDHDGYKIEDFAQHAFAAIEASSAAPDHAIARAASVLGNADHICHAAREAGSWFEIARTCATWAGDAAMTSAVIFNMAATRFSVARVKYI